MPKIAQNNTAYQCAVAGVLTQRAAKDGMRKLISFGKWMQRQYPRHCVLMLPRSSHPCHFMFFRPRQMISTDVLHTGTILRSSKSVLCCCSGAVKLSRRLVAKHRIGKKWLCCIGDGKAQDSA